MIILQKKTKYEKDFQAIFSAMQKKFRKRNLEVFFDIISKKSIAELNFQTRNINKPTDVLSFSNLNIKEGNFDGIDRKQFKNPATGGLILGEIAICSAVAKEQAKAYNHSERREFCFLFLHGLLHLFGFEHETEEGRNVMENISEEILSQLDIKR